MDKNQIPIRPHVLLVYRHTLDLTELVRGVQMDKNQIAIQLNVLLVNRHMLDLTEVVHSVRMDKNQIAIRAHVLLVNRHMLDLTEVVHSVRMDKNQIAIRAHVLLVNRHMLELTELVQYVQMDKNQIAIRPHVLIVTLEQLELADLVLPVIQAINIQAKVLQCVQVVKVGKSQPLQEPAASIVQIGILVIMVLLAASVRGTQIQQKHNVGFVLGGHRKTQPNGVDIAIGACRVVECEAYCIMA